jgi:hypothetical protein
MNGLVLLAAGAEGFMIIVLIVFIVIPLLGVVTSKLREFGQPANPLPPDRGGSGKIQVQIDEFLRRAAQRRGGQPPVAERPKPEPKRDDADSDDAPVGGRLGQASQKYMDTSDFGRRSEELGGEVAQSDRQFTQQVGHAFSGEVGRLSTRPGESAQPVEVIDAEVVGPEYLSRPTLEALPVAGSGLGELLGSPENIAQAVIMAEVLRRPEW